MDNKLLNALNNIGDALDALVEALNDKASAKSDAGTALQSGDFGKQLESISKDIKSIKADTQEILKQQKTILSQAKSKEADSKLGIMDSLGGDDSMMKNITKGIGVIMLLAVAVLAIGMAFKLVGKVDILSVIGLALGITIISHAFAEIVKLKIGWKEAAMTSLVMIIMSVGIAASSWILSTVTPLSIGQIITAVTISAMFYFILPVAATMIKSMESEDEVEFRGIKIKTKGLKFSTVLAAAFALPLIMIGISVGITTSSWILSGIKEISIKQALTAVVIGFVFSLLGPVISSIITGITTDSDVSIPGLGGIKKKGLSIEAALVATTAIPIIMMAMSLAILGSSYILSNVQPVGFMQLLTSIAIAGVFTVLAYGLSKIVSALGKISPILAVATALIIPIIFIALSYTMVRASENFAKITPIGFSQFMTAIALGVVFAVLSISIWLISKAFSGLNAGDAILLAFIIPVLFIAMSYTIKWVSEILAGVVPLDNGLLWNIVLISIAVAAMSIVMGIGIKVLSMLGLTSMKGLLTVALGGVAILLVASTIMLASHILAEGNYDTFPSLDWAMGVSLSLGAFALGMTLLGALIFSTFGVGAGMLAAGSVAVLGVAATIVAASDILTNGYTDKDGNIMKPDYSGGPSEEWAKGVSLALAAFWPIYDVMLANTGWFSSGVDVDDFIDAIESTAIAITVAAIVLNQGDGVWQGGPTEDWARGVSLALGAFWPIYEVLLANQGWFSSGVSVEDFTKAIKTTAKGIVAAAEELNQSEEVWKGGPTKNWAEGVSLALGAFWPVYQVLLDNVPSFWSSGSGVSVEKFTEAIETVSKGIVTAAKFFASDENLDIWGGHPTKEWAEGVGIAIGAFAPVFEILAGQTWLSRGVDANDMKSAILTISQGIVDAAMFFNDPEISKLFNTMGSYPSKEWGEGVGAAVGAFAPVFEALQGRSWYESGPKVINDMVNGIRRISGALTDSARAFGGYEYDWETGKWNKSEDLSGMWSAYPSESWAIGVRNSVTGFLDIFDELENRGYTTAQFSILSEILNYGLSAMSRAARTLYINKEYFDVELNPDFIQNIAKNVLGFAELGLKLDEMLVSEKIITKESSGFFGIGASKETETVKETKDLGIVDMVVGNLVRVAKTLFFNKKYFENTEVYDGFYKDVVSPSGIIWRFSRLASHLFNKDFDEFYSGLRRTNYISRALVKTAKILYSGQEYFGMSIDPNYMKNVGQNILDFNELVKQLIQSEGGKGFWDKVGDFADGFFGTDPISQIAKRMITLADGYDKLANSLMKLGIAMRTLNISDASKLGGLTKSIISTDESKDISKSFLGSSPTMQQGDNSWFSSLSDKLFGGDDDDEEKTEDPIASRLDQVIELLTSINNNTVNINQFIELQSEGEIEAPTEF
jgi:hypothetical protein